MIRPGELAPAVYDGQYGYGLIRYFVEDHVGRDRDFPGTRESFADPEKLRESSERLNSGFQALNHRQGVLWTLLCDVVTDLLYSGLGKLAPDDWQ